MHKTCTTFVLAAALVVAFPAIAQAPTPGVPDATRVLAGSYKVDTNHTQVVWTVDHMGISPLSGAFGASGGILSLDPTKPSAAKVTVTFNVSAMSTTVPDFTKHLSSADFFEVAKFPTASFTSTAVEASGDSAKITGNLTIKDITKPVTLDAKFYGAGVNPMDQKLNVGFTATTSIKRSDFGLGYALPVIPDRVELRIAAAFERVG